MPDGDQLELVVVLDIEILLQVAQQGRRLCFVFVKTYREANGRILHQVDLDTMLRKI